MVRQAVRDVRTAPPPPPADPLADPTVAALCAVVDDLAASTHAIGEPLAHGLAARRYAMSGDRRALARHRPLNRCCAAFA
ncbi:hypothetical protein [Streptomyces sp. NPDC004976]